MSPTLTPSAATDRGPDEEAEGADRDLRLALPAAAAWLGALAGGGGSVVWAVLALLGVVVTSAVSRMERELSQWQ